jgi:putative addiction module killer protein
MMARRKPEQEEESPEPDALEAPRYQIRVLVEEGGNIPFLRWRNSLRDVMAKARIAVRLTRIAGEGNFGDHRERISGAVSELRLDYGPGYRVYYVLHGSLLVILLGGGTKDGQQSDILAAHALWEANKDDDERFSRDFGG